MGPPPLGNTADPFNPLGGVMPPVLVAPSPPGPALSGTRVAPLPTTFVPVYAWTQQLMNLAYGVDGTGGLRRSSTVIRV